MRAIETVLDDLAAAGVSTRKGALHTVSERAAQLRLAELFLSDEAVADCENLTQVRRELSCRIAGRELFDLGTLNADEICEVAINFLLRKEVR